MDSPLARFDPRAKLVAMLAVIGAIAALRSISASAAALAAALALLVWSRLPLQWVVYRLGIVIIAVAPVVVLLPLFSGEAGWTLGATVALKAVAITAIALTFTGRSPSPTLAWAARQFGVPRTLVRIAMLTRRFGHVLGHEMIQMQSAARCRGADLGIHPRSLRTAGTLVGSLLIRSVSRAERVAQALQCRGDVGEIRMADPPIFRVLDAAFILIAVVAAALLLVWDYRLAH
jgi:cobalt/nickel transport system permease protein